MQNLPPTWQVVIFLAGAGVILVAGSRLANLADRFADQTGIGEALTGAIMLGAATSLSGAIVSAITAWNGYPSLSYSNAVGGIAVQTVFLVIADAAYRRSNLEHAAASLPNMANAAILVVLLSLMIAAAAGPQVSIFGVHPVSLVIPVAYVAGLRVARGIRNEPMWTPRQTESTREDRPDEGNEKQPLSATIPQIAISLVAVGVAGWVVAETGTGLSRSFGLSQSLVGSLMTAVATSLPECVTTVAAVRRGALSLAVGGIIGGNAFDTLFVSVADIAYRDGSIYHAVDASSIVLTAMPIAMTGILLLGLIHRQRQGWGGIGFEGWLILALYPVGMATALAAV